VLHVNKKKNTANITDFWRK